MTKSVEIRIIRLELIIKKERKVNIMTNVDTAVTILNQLGGKRFTAMTGAKNFGIVSGGNGIGFMIPRSNGIRGVRIILSGLDLYDMVFLDSKFDLVREFKGVYNDQLQDIFTEVTGLSTRL